MRPLLLAARAALLLALLLAANAAAQTSYSNAHQWWEPNQDEFFPWDSEYDNATGLLRISSLKGSIRTGPHPFFRPLGENGRACITCHQPSNAMSLSGQNIRRRWAETKGQDPLFAPIDGANCPTAQPGDAAAHSLLLRRGLFRIGLPWPPKDITPDFQLELLKDPTGCALGNGQISVYRRPRMSANLAKLVPGPDGPVLMGDGRAKDLRAQAIDAVLVHQQAKHAPSDHQIDQILDFELQLVAGQYADHRGGLTASFAKPESGTVGRFRESARRGQHLFASRCSGCHQPGQVRWQKLPKPELAELPLFRVTCRSGETLTTQDPGRALITGRCADVGAIVIPQLSGLASRPPYFSNGSAETLEELVDSYRRLGLSFTPQEREDLVNFLLNQ